MQTATEAFYWIRVLPLHACSCWRQVRQRIMENTVIVNGVTFTILVLWLSVTVQNFVTICRTVAYTHMTTGFFKW